MVITKEIQFLVLIFDDDGTAVGVGGLFKFEGEARQAVADLQAEYFANHFGIQPIEVGKSEVISLVQENDDGFACLGCGVYVDEHGLCGRCKI